MKETLYSNEIGTKRKWQPWPLNETQRYYGLAKPHRFISPELSNSPYTIDVDLDRVAFIMYDLGFFSNEIKELNILIRKSHKGMLGSQSGKNVELFTGHIYKLAEFAKNLDEKDGLRRKVSPYRQIRERTKAISVDDYASAIATNTLAHELRHYYQRNFWPTQEIVNDELKQDVNRFGFIGSCMAGVTSMFDGNLEKMLIAAPALLIANSISKKMVYKLGAREIDARNYAKGLDAKYNGLVQYHSKD